MSLRRVVVCVDDFGLSPAVDAAVMALAGRGAISATSCLVNMPGSTAGALQALAGAGIDVGLHLNFTEGAPVSDALRRHWPEFPTLGRLLMLSHAGRLPLAAIADEAGAQFDRFRELSGQWPDFVDGHQHVHHLPGIRDGWLPRVAAAPPGLYVRDAGRIVGPGSWLKRQVIQGTGATALRARLAAQGLVALGPLVGVYDFADPDYRQLVRRWLAAAAVAGETTLLLFCHPADPTRPGAIRDPIAAARSREWAYLSSVDWPADLRDAGAMLVRGEACARAGVRATPGEAA